MINNKVNLEREYVVCNGYHQRVSIDFTTREDAHRELKSLLGTAKDDGLLHVVEKQTPIKSTK